jgi:hypothetical protein
MIRAKPDRTIYTLTSLVGSECSNCERISLSRFHRVHEMTCNWDFCMSYYLISEINLQISMKFDIMVYVELDRFIKNT